MASGRDRQRERREKGLCCSCNSQALFGKSRCQACTDAERDRARERYRAKHPSAAIKAAKAATSSPDYHKTLYAKRVAAGLCPACEAPRCAESVYCQVCLDKQRERQRKASQARAEVAAATDQATKAARQEAGRCVGCGVAGELFTDQRCRRCESLRLENEEGLSRYAARMRVGLCGYCASVANGDKRCPACKEKRRQQTAARKAAGICLDCNQSAALGDTRCVACGSKRRKSLRERWAAQTAKGLCTRCDEPFVPGLKYCVAHAEHARKLTNAKNKRYRDEIIAAYGGKCSCPGCPETRPEFLTIDHIADDGAKHRRSLFGRNNCGSAKMYAWLKKQGFPKDNYQLLCHNCNWVKHRFGSCPHVQPPPETA